jgi:hypothetical protein
MNCVTDHEFRRLEEQDEKGDKRDLEVLCKPVLLTKLLNHSFMRTALEGLTN